MGGGETLKVSHYHWAAYILMMSVVNLSWLKANLNQSLLG